MNLRIKICGITNAIDAHAAVEAGADALGFMFYEQSPRNVSLAQAAQIIKELPPFIAKVGVFVDAPAEFIRRAIEECGINVVQLHGNELPEFCQQFSPAIKAFRIRDAESLRELTKYQVSAWLLDSFSPEKFGGTGTKFNWDLAAKAKELGRPIILAGGLTHENIGQAVRQVWPYAVDVSSGVESKIGQKDHGKLEAFIRNARQAAANS